MNACFHLIALLALSLPGVCCADTWWVDRAASGSGDGSESSPFATIQDAINATTTKAGDTIRVRPGVYDVGGATKSTISQNRVVFTKKLTIESTDGKAATHIVGRHATDATYEGCGTDAVRCVWFDKNASGSVLKGFTLRDGGTQYDNQGGQNCGGGAFVDENAQDVSIVDCVVSNCVGTRGAAIIGMQNGNTWAIRTLICNNRAPGTSTKSILRYMNLFSCVVAHNSSVAYLSDYPHNTINCTIYENYLGNAMFQAQKCRVLNSLLLVGSQGGNAAIGTTYKPGASGDTSTYVTNCVCSTERGPAVVADSVTDATIYQLKGSAPDGPWLMPIASSPAVGTGSPEHLSIVPEAYRDLDFYGNPRTTDGTLNVGAVEGSAPAGAGFAQFLSPCRLQGEVSVFQPRDYFYPDTAPGMVKIQAVVPDGLLLYRYMIENAYSALHFPERDDSLGLYVPPTGSATKVRTVFTGAQLHVDAAAAPDGADGSEEHPYPSIMAALAAANAATNTRIEVAAGEYAAGEGATDCHGYRRVVIDKPVFIRGAGAGQSIIRGAPASGVSVTEAPYGCGEDAVACVIAKNVACGLQGFTLTDGYTRPQQDDFAAIRGGGFFSVNASANGADTANLAHVLDCTITNCVATRSAAAGGGCVLFRCWITGSRGTNNGIVQDAANCSSCIFRGNVSFDDIGNGCHAYNCTVIHPGSAGWMMNPSGYAYNCVFLDGGCVPGASANRSNGSVTWNCYPVSPTDPYSYFETTVHDPGYLDPVRWDFRMPSSSDILGRGDLAYTQAKFMTSDFNGHPLVFHQGQPTPGAFQELVPCATIFASSLTQASDFAVTVNDAAGALTNFVAAGDVVSVAYTGARNFDHFEIDGVAQPAGQTSVTLTVPDDVSQGWGCIVAVLGSAYYVDDVNGNDGNTGWTPQTAKKTLAAALALAVAGDVVHAAEGVYDEGAADQGFSVYVAKGRTIPARAPVPAGVHLVADGAVDRTVIRGGRSSEGDAEGMGPGAVRCVTLGNNATVEGFTIADGRCLIPDGATPSNAVSPPGTEEYNGGGVMGESTERTQVIGCIVTNCCGCRGGAAWQTTFRNCRIVDNMSCWNAPAGSKCRYYDCFVDGNLGENTSQECAGYYGTTYGPNNGYGTSHYSYNFNRNTKTSPVIAPTGTPICNSVFMQSVYNGEKGNGGSPSHCALVSTSGNPPNAETWSDPVLVPSVAALKLDADFRPLPDSPLVDAGDRTLSAGETDLAGGQRVYNGEVDIGCFECDWRPAYVRDLGTSRFAVTNAAPDAVEAVADGKSCVALADGASLAGVWTPTAAGSGATSVCYMTATLTGTGTLVVTRNGAPYATYAEPGAHEIRVGDMQNGDAFAFAWTASAADAVAQLSGFFSANGTILLVR